jgi:predicted metal-dependent phosphoesterase TrpH
MKFDLHIHSNRSYDSLSRLESILTKAREAGLDGIAITDHDVFTRFDVPGLEERYGIWLIPGVEVATSIGDILALFVSRPVTARDAAEAIDEIHAQGGIAILAHPYKRNANYTREILEKLDGIEQINSRWIDLHAHAGHPGIAELLSVVKGRTAGSDAHFIAEIGNAYLETPRLTKKYQLREIIRTGAGMARHHTYTRWQDFFSQCVKFGKRPGFRQGLRLGYHFIRQVARSLRPHGVVEPGSLRIVS